MQFTRTQIDVLEIGMDDMFPLEDTPDAFWDEVFTKNAELEVEVERLRARCDRLTDLVVKNLDENEFGKWRAK